MSIFLGMLVIQCGHKNKKDYYDLYRERILLETLLAPTPNPKEACMNTYKASEVCLAQTNDAKLYPGGFNEAGYAYTISKGAMLSYSALCDSSLNSAEMQKYSPAARECIEVCQKKYWENKNNAKVCPTTSFADLLNGISSGMTDCIKTSCAQLTNVEIKL